MAVKGKIQSVCIAVRDLKAATEFVQNLFDAPLVKHEFHPEQHTEWTWFDFGGVFLELVACTSGTGEVSKFIEKKGEGLFLFGLEVDDMDEARDEFIKGGAKVVYQRADDSFPGGGFYNFVHPKSFFGTMIEFRQFNGKDDFTASLTRRIVVNPDGTPQEA